MLGAAAFIIAEWLSIPYIEIVKISIVPAILYFVSVGAFIHFRSIKLDIKVEPPKIKTSQIIKDRIHFVVPVFFVIYFLAALVLGMGLPVTAAYITLAIFAGPALETVGLPILIAHMIIFWLSQTSAITPPVCIVSYAAAGIAKPVQ